MDAKVADTRYDGLDGVRAFSAIGIVIMHVLANGKYTLSGCIFKTLIPSFANLVFLFMILSAFSVCCGYYDKIRGNKIALERFYQRRFLKILPFFGLLNLMDVVISPSWEAVPEMFANLTLCFGFLPDAGNISVIGVGWFLGVICVFYIIFPFYCCLLGTKRRAWTVLVITYLFHVICADYFGIERTNILYNGVYLVFGGVIYLYRDSLSQFSKQHRILAGVSVLVSAAIYYIGGAYVLTALCLYGSIQIYAMGAHRRGILLNRYTKYLSTISMEIYLGHMVCYRVVERMGLLRCFESELASFAFAAVLTLMDSVLFAAAARWGFAKIGSAIQKVHAVHAEG